MSGKNNLKRNIWIGIFIVIGIFFIISFLPLKFYNININNVASSTNRTNVPLTKPLNPHLFSDLHIQAKAAYVYDLTDGRVLFEKNANIPLPLASITKLTTALVSSQILSDKDLVTVSPASLAIDGDNGLIENEIWWFKDLRDFTLIVSSNDGANAIAIAAGKLLTNTNNSSSEETGGKSNDFEKIFVNKMNDETATLGLSSFHFENESGLDVNGVTPGGVGSAKDVSSLLAYLIKNYPAIIEITKYRSFKFTSLSGIKHNVYNTDEDIGKISHIIASKTGFTSLAGGNLVVAYDPGLNHPVIIVVLGSTQAGRFTDTSALASSTVAYLRGE